MSQSISSTRHWYSPEFFANPYPFFDALRKQDPLHWSEPLGGWVVTGYQEVVQVLRNPADFSSVGRMAALLTGLSKTERAHFQPVIDHFSVGMIRSDPPDHTRLRRLINKAFTPRRVTESRHAIESIVNELLARWDDRREVDLVEALAFPLPASVICRMLGLPPEDSSRIHQWTLGMNSVIAATLPLREAAEQMQHSFLEMQQYYRQEIANRRQAPRDDLLSLLVVAEDEQERLSEAELISTAENLFSAGHETTTSLIANGVLTLLKHPEQLQQLAESPDAPGLSMAIEEILRFESPVQRQTRVVRHNCELAGQQMRQGQLVFVMIGAANRDPAEFDQPNRFDIQRNPNKHIAFGAGVHFCIGAPLARLEAEIAFTALLDRWQDFQLISEEVDWMESAALRCPAALPIRLR